MKGLQRGGPEIQLGHSYRVQRIRTERMSDEDDGGETRECLNGPEGEERRRSVVIAVVITNVCMTSPHVRPVASRRLPLLHYSTW